MLWHPPRPRPPRMRRFVNLGLCKHRVVTVCREWNRLLHDEHRAFYELIVTAVLSVCVCTCVYMWCVCLFATLPCILQLYRADFISAMKLPDTQHFEPSSYLNIKDPWRTEWEKGVQVQALVPRAVNLLSVLYAVDKGLCGQNILQLD